MSRRPYDPDSLEEELAIMEERELEGAFELASLETRVEEMLVNPLIVLGTRQTVAAAIDAMLANHVGAIGVVAGGEVVGIFTERDVVSKIAARGLDARDVTLEQVMTPRPESVRVDDTLASVAYEMLVQGFCHVPICDVEGNVRHLVSLRDVVRFLLKPVERRISTSPPFPYHGEVRLDVEYG